MPSLNSVPAATAELLGRRQPRLFTEPLRELTPETSLGFSVAAFARDVLGEPLLPWQEEAAIRMLETNPDGSLRFRTILLLVARQSGKTHLMRVLGLWFLYVERVSLVLSVAQSLEIAKEAWRMACHDVESVGMLAREKDFIRRANGDETLHLTENRRWRLAAGNRKAGRGLSVDVLFMDELREQRKWDAWSALSATTTSRPNAITLCLSNAGDDESVVLNHLRESALAGTDARMCLLEWSAPDGADLDDREAWAQANPALGHTVPVSALESARATDPPAVFRTERLCQRVESLNNDQAIDPARWHACADKSLTFRDQIEKHTLSVCLDVSMAGDHATLSVAAMDKAGRVRTVEVDAWEGPDAARAAVAGLPTSLADAGLASVRRRGYFRGPSDGIRADLEKLGFKPLEATVACAGLADEVRAGTLLHGGSQLTSGHVLGAKRYPVSDGWRFVRKGEGNVDAAYAAAGAVHLARAAAARPSFKIVTVQ